MALRRFTRPVDGTIPVQALLYNDEEIHATQDSVGIYDGPQKSPNHQSGSVYITSHRLFYIDALNAFAHSFLMDLSYITRTESYAGLFKSSPKITLHLSRTPATLFQDSNGTSEQGFESWECEVCGYRNPPGLRPAAARVCELCGVPRSSLPVPIPSVSPPQHMSSSLPASIVSSSPSPSSITQDSSDMESIACPACTFLNHPSLRSCEICSSDLPLSRNTSALKMRSEPGTRPVSPDSDDHSPSAATKMIKISFRKGGDKPFYTLLKRSLQSKLWETDSIGYKHDVDRTGPETSQNSDRPNHQKSGITGILQTVETSAQSRESGMMNALQDLEALMVKAKDMVRLAAELNDKLTAASTTSPAQDPLSSSTSRETTVLTSSSTEPEEATFIRSSLSQLGLQMSNTPVTLDMMKDERRWIEELARELGQVLQGSPSSKGGIMKGRGMIALDEAWGGWNRARGVALIPPSTFLQVIPQLPLFTDPPIQCRTFTSGLSVLHTPRYTHAAFAARLSGLLALTGPKTTMEVAREENITVGLSAEMIAAVEVDGDICRDDTGSGVGGSGGELRWWVNIFVRYVWDGQE